MSNTSANKYQQSGQMDVFIALKNNIFRHLKVASIGKVLAIDTSTNLINVEPLPLLEDETSKSIYCLPSMIYNGSEWVSIIDLLSEGDIVLILYLDRKTDSAITNLMNGLDSKTISKTLPLHSESYGVVISVMVKK